MKYTYECGDCNKSGGNNCKMCNIDYEYEFKDLEVNKRR